MSLSRPVTAVYGGTFDPFHNGHQAVVDAVLAETQVSYLRIVPCFIPALKANAKVSAAQRLEMLQQWQQTQHQSERIIIDSVELDRQGPSYTVETMESLTLKLPSHQFVFVLGADAWHSLPKWHRYEELAKQVSFWVFAREGETDIQPMQGIRYCESFQELLDAGQSSYWVDRSVRKRISSSDIRVGNSDKASWLPESISNYIQHHGLYDVQPFKPQEGN